MSSALTPHTVKLRFVRHATGAELTVDCDGRVTRLRPDANAPPSAGRYSLVFGSLTPDEAPSLAVGVVRRLALHGARVLPRVDEDPARRAAHHLVEGEPADALALLVDRPDLAVWRSLARDDLHALPDEPTVGEPDFECTTCQADLALRIRTRPALAAALRAGPAGLPLLDWAFRGLGHAHRRDPAVRRGRQRPRRGQPGEGRADPQAAQAGRRAGEGDQEPDEVTPRTTRMGRGGTGHVPPRSVVMRAW